MVFFFVSCKENIDIWQDKINVVVHELNFTLSRIFIQTLAIHEFCVIDNIGL